MPISTDYGFLPLHYQLALDSLNFRYQQLFPILGIGQVGYLLHGQLHRSRSDSLVFPLFPLIIVVPVTSPVGFENTIVPGDSGE